MGEDYLFENTKYYINPCEFTDPVLGERITGYGIFNKATGIREAETRRFNTAITFATQFLNEEVEREMRELEQLKAEVEFPIQ